MDRLGVKVLIFRSCRFVGLLFLVVLLFPTVTCGLCFIGVSCNFNYCIQLFNLFPRASERRVFQKEGGVNRSTYKRSSHMWYLLTTSHIWHLLTSSHIWHLLTSDIFSHLLTSDIFSHLTSSHIFSHLTSSHIFSHLTSSHISHLTSSRISHLHISLLYSFYLRRGAGPADHHERRPSAEIVRVGCAKPRRNCVCAGAWSTLCGDRACRMRET